MIRSGPVTKNFASVTTTKVVRSGNQKFPVVKKFFLASDNESSTYYHSVGNFCILFGEHVLERLKKLNHDRKNKTILEKEIDDLKVHQNLVRIPVSQSDNSHST